MDWLGFGRAGAARFAWRDQRGMEPPTMQGSLATILADGIYIGGGVILAILIILVLVLLLRRSV
jgi:hypothetical protein